jgi:hypothetical protein
MWLCTNFTGHVVDHMGRSGVLSWLPRATSRVPDFPQAFCPVCHSLDHTQKIAGSTGARSATPYGLPAAE